MHHRLKQAGLALAALVIVLVAILAPPLFPERDDAPPAASGTVTVKLAPAARAAVPDRQLEVPARAVAAVAASEADDHDGSRDEQPAGVTAAQLEAGREQQDQFASADQLPVSPPAAAPEQAGCRSRFIASYSSRRGVAPRLIVLHYTVSPNRVGWSDVDGVTAYFARPATQASSNYVIDGEGHCNYIVREVDKAWAQAAANPLAISIEVINTGREPRYIAAAGERKLARVVHDIAKRWSIPLQTGAVNGCTLARTGIVTHQMLGACGGGHVDVSPYTSAVSDLLTDARDLQPAKVTAVDRRTCQKLNAWRRAGRPAGGKWETNSVRRRRALDARRVTCTKSGPVRTA